MQKSVTIETRRWIAGLLAGLASTLSALAADLNVPAQYPTIQAAVNAASSGDTIHIAPGVYVEQITISHKNLTLAGMPGAVIRAKTGMAQTLVSFGGTPNVALLGIALSDVVIEGLTFEGDHLADGQPNGGDFVGIYYWGSSGQVTNCTVMGFRGNAVATGDAAGFKAGNHMSLGTPPVHVEVLNNTFADNYYSIVCYGDHFQPNLVRVTFTIQDNVIKGIGPTDTGTQAGIGIGAEATGDVKRNVIADHSFTGNGLEFSYGINATSDGGRGIEPLQAIHYEGNTFRNNQLNLVSLLGNGSQFVNNMFAGPGTGYRSHGLVVSGNDTQIVSNRFSNLPTGILLLGDDPDFGTALGIATNATLIGNRFCDVAKPIDIEPLVTGTTEQGTLPCPPLDPTLSIAPAVLLTWPAYTDGWVLESSPAAIGPWTSSAETPTLQGGQNTVAVKTDSGHQFFRLRSP